MPTILHLQIESMKFYLLIFKLYPYENNYKND